MIENIFNNLIINKEKEQFFDLLKKDNIRVEKIVSNGQISPNDFWYKQDENEFVIILKGEAVLEFEDKEISLKVGDYINIEANVKHRVKYTSKDETTLWLAIFY
ncbi:cupin domain-containing protein [Halarcobacter anaerophilus]|uniref:Cupin n=1 Tax=Halarcobacter anaerophilus TaxID=877500 RepID=A0A4Q0Y067_9BACT|nr:cupin domain-containing protein [Halarcobacter anaerophilus]QDF28681.1 Cupin domain-containing protein [Halarcobacter anaerophilus]RXJ63400.1 cupin [Halarcobacter anaerophilus]